MTNRLAISEPPPTEGSGRPGRSARATLRPPWHRSAWGRFQSVPRRPRVDLPLLISVLAGSEVRATDDEVIDGVALLPDDVIVEQAECGLHIALVEGGVEAGDDADVLGHSGLSFMRAG